MVLREKFTHWMALRSTGTRRAVGLLCDCLCCYAICFIPLVYHVNALGNNESIYATQRAMALPLILVSLVAGPLPLIVLRFVCKCVLKGDTPGEFLTGYAFVSRSGAFRGALKQLFFGLTQYMFILAAMLFAVIVYWAGWRVCEFFLGPLPSLIGFGELFLWYLVWRMTFSVLCIMLEPWNGIHVSGIVKLCGMQVIDRYVKASGMDD